MALTIILVLLLLFSPPILCDYNVVDYGAVGDGKTDDTQSFLKAWAAACNSSGYPAMVVPSRKSFLLREVTFSGPCRSEISIQIAGTLVAPMSPWKLSAFHVHWITIYNVEGLFISGTGQINGQGAAWWACRNKGNCFLAPDAFAIIKCSNVLLSGINFANAPGKHVVIVGSTNVTVDHITVVAPENSPNTDGMHIEQSQHVRVSNSNFGSGDDCIAIGSGSSDVNITEVTCGPGHGISIGSLEKNSEVERILVSNCNLVNTTNGARIKTWQGGSGFARKIIFQHIKLTAVQNPIFINQYYPSTSEPNQTSAVALQGVQFIDIRGTSMDEVAINLSCSKTVSCTDISLQDINISPATPGTNLTSYCLNARGSASGTVHPPVPCLD